MRTGKLTPKSANVIHSRRYTGGFAQPDGFGAVLEVIQRQSGDLCLTLNWRGTNGEQMWSIELSNEQRNDLAGWIGTYQPIHSEEITNG